MLHTRIEPGEIPVIYLEGEIDLDSVETFRWVISDAIRSAGEAVVDFAGVTFIDSSGTGLLVRFCLDYKAQGVQLRLRNIPPVVDDVFRMLKVRALVGDEAFLDR
jgi:anti-anti-sigma factor